MASVTPARSWQRSGTIVYIGAGLGQRLQEILATNPVRLILVEPHPIRARELRRQTADMGHVEVLEAAVTPVKAPSYLKAFNIPAFSSLRQPTGLQELFPGLNVVEELAVETVVPVTLVERNALEPGQGNRLILDAPGEEAAIVESLRNAENLDAFDSIDLHCGQAGLYEGNASVETLLERLAEQGYKIEQHDDAAERDRPRWRLSRNPLKVENLRLKREIEKLRKQEDELSAIATERQNLLDKLTRENSAQLTEIAGLVQRQQDRLQNMERRLTQQIDYAATNLIRQIESFIGLDAYMNGRFMLPMLHGWPVSADFAMEMLRLIETNDYDLIVEFGSGASTLLMAGALTNKLDQNTAPRAQFAGPTVTTASQSLGSTCEQDDMAPTSFPHHTHPQNGSSSAAKRILSFEHQQKYVDETAEKLACAGVADFVDLIYAPLRDYVAPDGERFLYYACEEQLAAAAKQLAKTGQRILVLVDGPPGATGRHARRYPALPVVLQNMPGHSFHVFLDDYRRSDEKKIVELWKEFLDQHAISYELRSLDLEKGACLLITI